MTSQDAFAKHLRIARESCGFTVDYVARMIDVKPREIKKWESGEDLPDDSTIALLAKLYGVDLRAISDTEKAPSNEATRASSEDESNCSVSGTDPTGFSEYLETDESILWQGQSQTHRLNRSAFKRILTIAVLLLFYAVSEIDDIQKGEIRFYHLLLRLSVLTLLFSASEVYRILKRRLTHYIITDRRVLIHSAFLRKTCIEHRYATHFSPHLVKKAHGYGSIFLTNEAYLFATTSDPSASTHEKSRRENPDLCKNLIDIADAEEVFCIMTEAVHVFRRNAASENTDKPIKGGIL